MAEILNGKQGFPGAFLRQEGEQMIENLTIGEQIVLLALVKRAAPCGRRHYGCLWPFRRLPRWS
ncbi:hypothetical protein ACIBAI_13565 [Streptomyces sp. NPDC051041]|uniref:hypothetical protein n=1 Tax=Streptomyces sp. NPDC051041 TaxID=3365640 RepID=UPI00379EF9CA